MTYQYERGIMVGTGKNKFHPERTVSIAELLQTANRVFENRHGEAYCREILETYYAGPDIPFSADWRVNAMQHARAYRLCGTTEYEDEAVLKRTATRTEMVKILYGALPESDYEQINRISCLMDDSAAGAFLFRTDAQYLKIKRFYEAGILSGTNSSRDFHKSGSATRAELATVLTKLTAKEYRAHFEIRSLKTVYGFSGAYVATGGKAGHPLTAFRVGDGPHTLLLTFAIHGNEGSGINGDGAVLSMLADKTLKWLEETQLQEPAGWSVYILPACNPDGIDNLLDTYAAVDAGRRTSYRYADASRTVLTNGGAISGGIDLNRCWPSCGSFNGSTAAYGYDSQYYTGPFPMAAPEAEYLSQFAKYVRGTGKNLVVDTHGWFTQILGTHPYGKLYGFFHGCLFPGGGTYWTHAGYWSAYAVTDLGYNEAILVELPSSVRYYVNSCADIWNNLEKNGWNAKFLNAVGTVLKSYY